MDDIIANYEISNMIVEMKADRDISTKRDFLNYFRKKGYYVFSYQEQYDQFKEMMNAKYVLFCHFRVGDWC